MKRRDLERALAKLGFGLKREGGSHAVWTNGHTTLSIPRHREVTEHTAQAILKEARDAQKEEKS